MSNLNMIGDIIKLRRKSKNLTLQQLSQLTGLSIGYLSNLERNACSPTLECAHNVCLALDMTLGDLFSQISQDKILIKKDERDIIVEEVTKFKYESLSYGKNRLEGIFLTVYPNTISCNKEWEHSRDEIGIILEGEMDIILQGITYSLKEGDSFYIDAEKSHSFINKTDKKCVSYWVYNQSNT